MTAPLVLDRAVLDAASAALPPEAAHLRPILEAVANRGLVHVLINKDDRLSKTPAKLRDRPMLVQIGDDLDTSCGPDAFRRKALLRALDGCTHVMIHAAAPSLAHYEAAVLAALMGGRAVLIETQPAHETAWLKFVSRHAPQAAVAVVTSQCGQWSRTEGMA